MTTLLQEQPAVSTKKGFPPFLAEETERAIVDMFGKIFGETKRIDRGDFDHRNMTKIAAMISFVGDINFAFALVIPKDVASGMAMKFAGLEVGFESEEIADITGELANIVAGGISGNLESHDCKVQMSFPTIFRGDDYEQIIPPNFLSTYVFFDSDDFQYWAKLTVMEND